MSKNHLYKGTLSALILKLLDRHGRMYGYEISKKAHDATKGDLKITEGALYPALHKLEADGILITEIETIGKRKRKYYLLAPDKKSEVKRRIEEFAEYAKNLQSFLNPTPSHG